ncbi:hypothetical protein DR864_08265 [Runella rosea]|uniref:Glycosyltransferase RgtA/B/C/D-like domain-containing protein n=1 Tax=Runella rosea TaxID=2259595 RepID=A0A344TGF7_9BACT|nr:hypothetical protein [Runella rosea]AXE17728.1 hypothetical protein DR864_08265 [Runella rosea]
MPNRIALFFQFLLICAVVYLKLRADSAYFLTPDSHFYLEAAQNLLSGKGYVITFEGKETFCAIWPMGYSSLIATVAFLTTFSTEIASKIVNLFALAGCFWLILRRFHDKAWFVSLGFLASSLIQLYTNTWSETVFILFVLGFAMFFSPTDRASQWQKEGSVIFAAAAFFTRYAGIFLLIPLLLRRQYKAAFYFVVLMAGYLFFNFYHTGTYTGGHGFWPTEPFNQRLWRGMRGLGEELLFFAVRDWDFKNLGLSDSVKWFIYGVALLQWVLIGLIVRHVVYFLRLTKKIKINADNMTKFMMQDPFFLIAISYLLFTIVVYLTDESIESLYFRRLAPSSLLFTLGILAWVSQQKQLFERTKWLFVAFFALSIIHSIPKIVLGI